MTSTTVVHAHSERADSLSNVVALPTRQAASRSPSRTLMSTDKALPPTPAEQIDDKATIRSALEDAILDSRPSIDGRPSIQSTRPSVKSVRTSYDYKPKIKLGPRPSLEANGRTYSSDKTNDYRPVSTLPTGVRIPARKAVPVRPKSANDRVPITEIPKVPLPQPSTASQSAPLENSWPATPSSLSKQSHYADNKFSNMTPEKRRLKKALEIRQKQMAAKSAQQNQKFGLPANNEDKSSSDACKHESLTSTLPEASSTEETTDVLEDRIKALQQNPDLVHVGPENTGKPTPETLEVSPISVPEESDGRSTQASSITDEDETPTKAEPKNDAKTAHREPKANLLGDQTPEDSLAGNKIDQPMLNNDVSAPPLSCRSDEFKVENCLKDFNTGDEKNAQVVDAQKSLVESNQAQDGPLLADYVQTQPSVDLMTPHTIRRSSSSKSVNTGKDVVSPCEVPLPPIDEDEDFSLDPRGRGVVEVTSSAFTTEDTPQQLASRQSQDREDSKTTKHTFANTSGDQHERRARRHGLISPVKRVSSPDFSDDHFLSDDSFMEELKSVTVQEAKPISVSKSPIMPVFPRSASDSKPVETISPSSSSNTLNRPKRRDEPQMMGKLPDLFSARSVSASSAPLLESQLSTPALKKVGVSSGISQRIKALEQLSSRPTSPSSQQSSSPVAQGQSTPFASTRKSSFRASQAAVEIAKSNTLNSRNRPQMHSSTLAPSPRVNSDDLREGLVQIDIASKTGKSRPDSISVTARIVRAARNKMPEQPMDLAEPLREDLYHSPLTVETQSLRPTSPPSPLLPPKPRYTRSISSTSTDHRSDPISGGRRGSISSRLSSTPSRRGSEPELPRSMSDSSILGITTSDAGKEDRKESRKSRLFKRMSNISAASRRTIVSALSPVRKDIKEEPIVEHHEPVNEAPQPVVLELGDVNVQFPDTLLWKRRNMRIDEHGNLVLSASKADNVSLALLAIQLIDTNVSLVQNSKVIPKRYLFADFNPPYIPDQDQQELPNSALLCWLIYVPASLN